MITKFKKAGQLILIIIIGIFLVATVVSFAHKSADRVLANGPILPPEGYPKLSLSTKVVTPTLAHTGATVLVYNVKILNTGAYTASTVTLSDTIPTNTTYNNDAKSSTAPNPVVAGGKLTWQGEVGFDSSVVITFSVTVSPVFPGGIITNKAEINSPEIAEPVIAIAETMVTDDPLFEISKSATPTLPGKNKPLTYELVVTNKGQPAINTPITVTDAVPANTSFLNAGLGGSVNPSHDVVTWTRKVDLNFGATTSFTFSVNVGNVPSGTVIDNHNYAVFGAGGVSAGEPYTTTVVDPILILSKSIYPDPPGSNSEVTYTLTVLNLGSKATGLVVTDTVPEGVEYVRGGDSYAGGVVTWDKLPDLDTRESLQVTFTGFISDIAGVIVLNNDYAVCSAEGVCELGIPVPSYIVGPTFEVTASLDPIAHKPGGGSGGKEEVTPTLTIKNLGPGNAIDATALLTFGRISVSNVGVLKVIPNNVGLSTGPACTDPFPCVNYKWTGNMNVGEMITITTVTPQSTIGGEEGTHYTATVVITDALGSYVTEPKEATAIGHVTHMSNLIPIKTAPPQIGPGQDMTYTIQVVNSGLSTTEPPPPVLTETLPANVTLQSISDGGTSHLVGDQTVISWNLPAMAPGDILYRSFEVKVDPGLVSGTLLVNDDYATTTYEDYLKGFKTIAGEPVTTTIHEVGLIDSYKTVTPTWALPGTGTVLTWTVHVANTGPNNLTGVQVTDIFPWQHSTYQRDAKASSGTIDDDIVSLDWTGDVAAYSEQLITFTTVVDDFFEGVLTNTATITHTSLNQPVEVSAVAYITDKPVLMISKSATPDPVSLGGTLLYKVKVTNLGQQATLLAISDTIPINTSYVFGSASSGGFSEDNVVQWLLPVLNHDDSVQLTFQVKVNSGIVVINSQYGVSCQEGVVAYGKPVVTRVKARTIFLPIIQKH